MARYIHLRGTYFRNLDPWGCHQIHFDNNLKASWLRVYNNNDKLNIAVFDMNLSNDNPDQQMDLDVAGHKTIDIPLEWLGPFLAFVAEPSLSIGTEYQDFRRPLFSWGE